MSWGLIVLWVVFVLLNAAVNAESNLTEAARRGEQLAAWEPWTWELSSAVSLLALTPALVLIARWLPVFPPRLWRNAAFHGLLTVPFSLLHVVMMVGLRQGVYASLGHSYDFGDWPRELLYEYRKDFLTYCLVIGSIHGWFYWRRVAAPQPSQTSQPTQAPQPTQSPQPAPAPSEPFLSRLLVQHNFREQIVTVDKVQWIEADGNYVKVHTAQGTFRPRMTLSSLESRLDPNRFVRIHRSHLVSLGAVKEVQPWFHGDFRVVLESGETVPLSRRFRDRIKTQ